MMDTALRSHEFFSSDGPIAPEAVIPEQFYDLRRARTGEQRLMAAVLDDAVRVYRRFDGRRLTRRQQTQLREVRRWMESNDRAWLFSFLNVCAVLSIDAQAVRTVLRSGSHRPARELKVAV